MDISVGILVGFAIGSLSSFPLARAKVRTKFIEVQQKSQTTNEELETLKAEIAARGIRLDELPEFFHEREQYEKSWTGEDPRAERPGGTKLRWDEIRRPDA